MPSLRCSQSVVTGSLPELVEAHELEHIRVYREAVTRELSAMLKRLEPMTGGFGELIDRYEAEWGRIDDIARVESKAIHNKKGNPNSVTPRDLQGECALKNEDGQELKNES